VAILTIPTLKKSGSFTAKLWRMSAGPLSLFTANDPEKVECVNFAAIPMAPQKAQLKLWNRQLWQTVHVLTPDFAALNFEQRLSTKFATTLSSSSILWLLVTLSFSFSSESWRTICCCLIATGPLSWTESSLSWRKGPNMIRQKKRLMSCEAPTGIVALDDVPLQKIVMIAPQSYIQISVLHLAVVDIWTGQAADYWRVVECQWRGAFVQCAVPKDYPVVPSYVEIFALQLAILDR
jgi:hypothetical protein